MNEELKKEITLFKKESKRFTTHYKAIKKAHKLIPGDINLMGARQGYCEFMIYKAQKYGIPRGMGTRIIEEIREFNQKAFILNDKLDKEKTCTK